MTMADDRPLETQKAQAGSAVEKMRSKFGIAGDILFRELPFFSLDLIELMAAYALCPYPSQANACIQRGQWSVPWMTPGTTIISSIACTSNGNVFVCDRQRVRVYDSVGSLVCDVGDGKMEPCAIAGFADRVFIAQPRSLAICADNGRVLKGINTGKRVAKPYAMAVGLHHIIIMEEKLRVQCHMFKINHAENAMEFVRSFTSNSPQAQALTIGIGQNGEMELFIVGRDTDGCIQVFNEKGQFLRQFGRHGDSGEFCLPSGVAMDSFGNLLVCDYAQRRVHVVQPADGKLVIRFHDYNSSSAAVGKERPTCVCTSAENGKVYVASEHGVWVYEFVVARCKRCFEITQECYCAM